MSPNFHILTVDDDKTLAQLMSTELVSEGYHVSTANDGAEAILSLREKKYDLVILDIHMPKADGFEVLTHIKENYPGVRVIMLTGYGDLTNALKAKRLGADDFVDKPYDLIELLTTIDRVLTG